MTVHDTERLLIWFKDVAGPADQLPATLPPATGAPRPPAPDVHLSSKPVPPAGAPAPATTPASPAADKPKKPIHLSARSIEAHVLRYGARNELEKINCDGAVHVHQDPEGPDDKGVDIRGQTLRLLKFAEGHVLTVTGETAEVQLDKLTIFGPEVNIDQKENKAWVNGPGAMRMPSSADLNGGKKETPTELTVYWARDMFFNGKYALFHGNVQAEQDASRLTCDTMQVLLDRFVSLKGENDRSKPPARVENLVCDKSVRVEDTQWENGKLVRYQRIDSVELS